MALLLPLAHLKDKHGLLTLQSAGFGQGRTRAENAASKSKWQGVSSEGKRAMRIFKDAAGYTNISYF